MGHVITQVITRLVRGDVHDGWCHCQCSSAAVRQEVIQAGEGKVCHIP